MTRHEEIVNEFLLRDNTMHNKKFRLMVEKKCLTEDMAVRIRPDVFKICENEFCRTVLCYEVEDNHRLCKNKIIHYLDLWMQLDGDYWDLNVYPVYRDMTIGKPIDLTSEYYKYLTEEYGNGTR